MTRVATTRQELRLNTAAVAVPVVAGGGAVVAALELTTGGPGYQLHLLQSAVVVAARALSRELTASQHRRWPGSVAVLPGSTVTPLRTAAVGVASAHERPAGRSAG
jgi:hypothetical protein